MGIEGGKVRAGWCCDQRQTVTHVAEDTAAVMS